MLQTLRRWGEGFNSLFEEWLFACVFLFMVAGWYFAPYMSPVAGRTVVPLLFAFMTWLTSMKCSWGEIGRIAAHPGPILVILTLLHLGVTFFGWGIGRLLYPGHADIIAGFVLCGAIPIGVTSAIWTGLAGGDVALTLAAVTIDTLLSPIVVPAVILLFLGQSIELNLTAIMFDLLKMIVIPSLVGLTMHDLSGGSLYPRVKPFLGPFANLALGLVVAINVATTRQTIVTLDFSLGFLLAVILLVVAFGYWAGAFVPRKLGYDGKTTAAVAYAVGIRNLSAGLVIALGHFPTLTIVPVVVSMLFQQPLAAFVRPRIAKNQGGPVV
ncbi:bile acid:sodium symporter family protein [Candidatus Ozemobacteraceae bacterium]|nr:bile acid:sodium symporter family protein [Candidatus Ozemobacteraceae bacterium]